MQPKAHRSAEAPASRLQMASGLMYSGVPQNSGPLREASSKSFAVAVDDSPGVQKGEAPDCLCGPECGKRASYAGASAPEVQLRPQLSSAAQLREEIQGVIVLQRVEQIQHVGVAPAAQ
eukprot:scaffold3685_cov242-Pinguiococcus_pyrenoidosus.AAC.6